MIRRRETLTLGLLLASVAAGVAIAGCGPVDRSVGASSLDATTARPAPPVVEDAVPVVIAELRPGALSSWIQTSGNLEAVDVVDVLAKVPGQIDKLLVEEGTRVTAGDALLQLDPNEYRLAAARAQAELDKKNSDLERYRRMLDEGVLSKVDFSQAEYDLRQAELALEQEQIDLREATVRAPIDGVISSRQVHRGARVTSNQHLFTIVDPDRLWVHVHVPEADLPGLGAGQPAVVSTNVVEGTEFSSEVARVSPVVDPQSGTAKVTIALDASGPLRPGMFVNVKIVTARRSDALLLPKRAVVYAGDQTTVYRIDDQDGGLVANQVSVRLGSGNVDFVEVLGGLENGARVVVLGQDALRTGHPVRIVQADTVGLPQAR